MVRYADTHGFEVNTERPNTWPYRDYVIQALNPDGFTCWLTGAGVRAGVSHGETDELGRKAVKDVHPLSDFNATLLHLLGLDHEKLTFEHNAVQRRLTSVEGNVIHEVLASEKTLSRRAFLFPVRAPYCTAGGWLVSAGSCVASRIRALIRFHCASISPKRSGLAAARSLASVRSPFK